MIVTIDRTRMTPGQVLAAQGDVERMRRSSAAHRSASSAPVGVLEEAERIVAAAARGDLTAADVRRAAPVLLPHFRRLLEGRDRRVGGSSSSPPGGPRPMTHGHRLAQQRALEAEVERDRRAGLLGRRDFTSPDGQEWSRSQVVTLANRLKANRELLARNPKRAGER